MMDKGARWKGEKHVMQKRPRRAMEERLHHEISTKKGGAAAIIARLLKSQAVAGATYHDD